VVVSSAASRTRASSSMPGSSWTPRTAGQSIGPIRSLYELGLRSYPI
jgi:hypothetical protein